MNWNKISDIKDLDAIIEASNKNKIVIFKHSTRCSISSIVLKKFEEKMQSNVDIIFFYLDLLNHRDVSSEISSRFNVVHQSPQLIVIQEGKLLDHASHNSILDLNL